jgi:hypothetical protein
MARRGGRGFTGCNVEREREDGVDTSRERTTKHSLMFDKVFDKAIDDVRTARG